MDGHCGWGGGRGGGFWVEVVEGQGDESVGVKGERECYGI